MSRIVKFVKLIRNNWKKSAVGVAALSYGISYGMETYETNLLMRAYCEEAAKFGNESLPPHAKPRHITVILNPIAKKRKSKQLFEKYCEPLLHLAGIAVTIIQTEQENQARALIENLNTPTDAILIAGGDGTLLDVVTGLMRKYDGNTSLTKQCPVGILPLGEINRIADSLFLNSSQNLPQVREMADATMAAIRGTVKLFDVVKVEPLENDPENPIKPIYAVGLIEWGAWRDAFARKDKYWYWGSLRRYVTYVFNGFKKDIHWDLNGTIRYTDPCSGCSQCREHGTPSTESSGRWWNVFIPRITHAQSGPDYRKIKNEKCNEFNEIPIATTELCLVTGNVENSNYQGPPSLKIHLGPETIDYTDFVAEGWRRIKGDKTLIEKTIKAKDIELLPNKSDKTNNVDQYFSIDNEEFELKPVKIKLIPQAVKIFVQETI